MIQLEHTLQAGEQLCFIHIPKTAGTTLISLLDAHFPVDRICPAQLWRELVWLPPDQVSACQLLRGHYTYDDYLKLASNPVFISMFRNPIDRACSYYNFMRNQPDDWLEQHYSYREALAESHPHVANLVEGDIEIYQRANRDDLETFFASSFVQDWIQNWQVKAIARSAFDQSPWAQEAALATAKDRLTTLVWFGLVERFADSMALLSYTFGWNPIRQYQRLMVAPNPNYTEGLSAKTVEILQEIHQLDLAFYDDAAAEFAQRYAAMQQDLQERYSGADLHDQLEQHYRDRTQALNLPRQTVIDLKFDQAIAGTGWQLREGSVEEQTLFRWTGPETETTLDLPLAAGQDFILKLRIVGAISEEVLDSVQLRVGDRPIPLTQLCREIRPGIYLVLVEGHIPGEVVQPDAPFTRLMFSVKETRSLHSLDASNPDRRPVGVALDWISLFPKAELGDPGYRCMMFPGKDAAWVEVAQWLRSHLQRAHTVVAPFEFAEVIPCKTMGYDVTVSTDPSSSELAQVDWLVIHKGMLAQIVCPLLAEAAAAWTPVYANTVFVVFTADPDIDAISKNNPDLLAFRADYQALITPPSPEKAE